MHPARLLLWTAVLAGAARAELQIDIDPDSFVNSAPVTIRADIGLTPGTWYEANVTGPSGFPPMYHAVWANDDDIGSPTPVNAFEIDYGCDTTTLTLQPFSVFYLPGPAVPPGGPTDFGTMECVEQNEAPGAFALLAPADGSTGVNEPVSLSWEASVDPDEDPVSYNLYLGTTPDGLYDEALETGITATSYDWSGGSPGVTYYWGIGATDGELETQVEGWWDFTLFDPGSPPELAPLEDDSVNEDTVYELYLWATDPDQDELSFSVVSDNPQVAVSWEGPVEGNDIDLSLTPAEDYYGSALITVTVEDPQGNSDSGSFTLAVNNVNDPPDPFDLLSPDDMAVIADEDLEVTFSWEEGSDPDPDEGPARTTQFWYSLYVSDSQETLWQSSVASWIEETSYTWTPQEADSGPWYWGVKTWDPSEAGTQSDVRSFTLDPPPSFGELPSPQSSEDQSSTEYIWASDPLFDVLTLDATTTNPNVSLQVDTPLEWNDMEITLTPDEDFYGDVEIQVTATDPGGNEAVDTFTWTVLNVNDPPDPFDLLAPADEAVLSDETVMLSWEEGNDPDPTEEEPSVFFTYTVYLSNDPDDLTGNDGYPYESAIVAEDIGTAFHEVTVEGAGPWYWRIRTTDDHQTYTMGAQVWSFGIDFPPVIEPIEDVGSLEEEDVYVYVQASDPLDDLLSYTVESDTPQVLVEYQGPVEGAELEIHLTPAVDWSGQAGITVTAEDPAGGTDVETFTYTVTDVNDPPYAFDLISPADEAVFNQVQVPLSWEAGDDPDEGSSFTYTVHISLDPETVMDSVYVEGIASPEQVFTATDFGPWYWTIETFDDQGESTFANEVRSFLIELPPSLNAINDLQTDEDTPLNHFVTANDPEGGALLFEVESDNPNVTAAFADSRDTELLVLTPAADWSGIAEITVTVTDDQELTASDSFQLTVNPVNDAPTLADQDLLTDEDTPLALSYNGEDPEDDPLSYNIVTPPVNGTVDNDTYTPFAEFFGFDSLQVVANDGSLDSNPAWFRITVTSINDAPLLSLPESFDFNEDESLLVDLESYVSDVDDNQWSYDVSWSNFQFDAVLDGSEVTFSANADWNGSVEVVVSVDDELNRLVATDTTMVNVLAVNDPPESADSEWTTSEDTTAEVPFQAADIDSGELSIVLGQGPFNGSYDEGMYTPAAEFSGMDSLSFTAFDGEFSSAESWVRITVTAVNDAPGIDLPESMSFAEDSTVVMDLSAFISDVDNSELALSVTGQGSLDVSFSGLEMTIVPEADWFGEEELTITVDDQVNRLTASDVMTVIYTAVNDAPQAFDVMQDIPEDTPTALAFNGLDIEEDPLQYEIGLQPSHGTVVDGVYTPAADYFGPDTLSYTANDGALSSAEAFVYITVLAGNDCPFLELPPDDLEGVEQPEDWTYVLPGETIAGWYTDPDGDPLTADSVFVEVSAFFSGVLTVDFMVTDGSCEVNGSVDLVIDARNDAPIVELCGPLDCGPIEDLEAFANAWSEVGLSLLDHDGDEMNVSWFVDGELVCSQQRDSLETCLPTCLDLAPWWTEDPQNITVHYEVSDDSVTINEGGADCSWYLDFLDVVEVLPTEFYLAQNYPNPFNPSTMIRFGLPHLQHVRAAVYNLQGRRVDVLLDETLPAGHHEFSWQAGDLASGVYILVMDTGREVKRQKMMLLR